MGPWLVEARDRDELDTWLGDDPPVPYRPKLMIVRGDGPLVRELLPNVLDAAKLLAERVVVWVKQPEMLTDDERRRMFRDDDAIVGAVLSVDKKVTGWLYRDQIEVDDAAYAFSTADGS